MESDALSHLGSRACRVFESCQALSASLEASLEKRIDDALHVRNDEGEGVQATRRAQSVVILCIHNDTAQQAVGYLLCYWQQL